MLGIEGYEIISRRDGRDTTNGRARGLLIYAKMGLHAIQYAIPGEDTVTEMTSIKYQVSSITLGEGGKGRTRVSSGGPGISAT